MLSLLLFVMVAVATKSCPTCDDWVGGDFELCGVDGMTYISKCDLFVSLCVEGIVSAPNGADINSINLEERVAGFIAYAGKCDGDDTVGNCPTCDHIVTPRPVCGDKEYSSYCLLAKELCENGVIAFDENTDFDSLDDEDFVDIVRDHVKWDGPCTGPCPGGKFSTSGQYPCVACSKGTYSDKTGSTQCGECNIGTYQGNTGATSCTECPENQTTHGPGSTSPDDCVKLEVCEKGSYSTSGYLPCLECPTDTYSDIEGAVQCITCPDGTHTAEEGSTSKGDCNIENIARRGIATQSGVTWGGTPEKAIDGDDSQSCTSVKCAHTRFVRYPWWALDLQEVYPVHAVLVSIPLDTVTGVESATVTVGNYNNASDPICGVVSFSRMLFGRQFIQCRPVLSGRHVRVNVQMKEATYMGLSEVEVYTKFPKIRCPKGTYSETGLYPGCKPCQVGYTNRRDGSTHCSKCREGTTALSEPGKCIEPLIRVCKNDRLTEPCTSFDSNQEGLVREWSKVISAVNAIRGNWELYSGPDPSSSQFSLSLREGQTFPDLRYITKTGYKTWNDDIQSLAVTDDDYTCYTGDGSHYTGHQTTTVTGRPCQGWGRNWPNDSAHKTVSGRYCRNPDSSPNGPWCYVRELDMVKESCGIPQC